MRLTRFIPLLAAALLVTAAVNLHAPTQAEASVAALSDAPSPVLELAAPVAVDTHAVPAVDVAPSVDAIIESLGEDANTYAGLCAWCGRSSESEGYAPPERSATPAALYVGELARTFVVSGEMRAQRGAPLLC